jgi:peptide chain release factor subunit 1
MQGDNAAVLILTPIKNAADFLDDYLSALAKLSYAPENLSLGFLESDSTDGTFEMLQARLPELQSKYARVEIWKHDYGFAIPPAMPRWAAAIQLPRRATLAKSRNRLLMSALKDEEWVLWIDSDVIEFPADIVERLLATERDIVHPHCVKQYGGPTFDLNAWCNHGKTHLDDLRGGDDLVRLDAVGGTMLLVRADLHRDGLIFPSFPFGSEHPAIRPDSAFLAPGVLGEIETEGLGIMAQAMGAQCWGMPNLEILHRED